MVARHAPRPPLLRNVLGAFFVGGAICAVGQVFLGLFLTRGLPLKEATTPASTIMIVLGALLTGLGVYDEVSKRGGMGAALPITGFANSIVAPAMEFRREGLVLGVGAWLFDVPFRGSLGAFALGGLLFLFVTLGMGVLVSSVSQNQGQAIQLAMMLLLPQVLLSGMIFPVSSMAAGVRWISYLLPLTYFIRIARGVMLRAAPVDALWSSLGLLAAVGV
ncbi:MAG: SpoVA/SpoVAEb family sporulation membrane protein, partial [Firmicutes bacterium]|nr:SpoVA/SpoVAEb family sporulation membrane protein [Bacillota bacterium]